MNAVSAPDVRNNLARRREQIERVRRMRAPASGGVDTVELLRRLRGYGPA